MQLLHLCFIPKSRTLCKHIKVLSTAVEETEIQLCFYYSFPHLITHKARLSHKSLGDKRFEKKLTFIRS